MVKQDRNKKALEDAQERNAHRLAKFGAMSEEDLAEINERTQGILNDKRQNYVQAHKDYALTNMILNEQMLYHESLEQAIQRIEKEIFLTYTDETKMKLELPTDVDFDALTTEQRKRIEIRGKDYAHLVSIGYLVAEQENIYPSLKLLRARAARLFVQLKFDIARMTHMRDDLMKTWEVSEEQIEEQINKWILGNQKIY